MALTNPEIDLAIPTGEGQKPTRGLINAAMKALAADAASALAAPSFGLSSIVVAQTTQSFSLRQAVRKAYCRPFWLAHRAELIARNPPVGNTGTVYYVDPTKATNGAGTFADAFNVAPSAATWQGNTILFAEMTSYNLSAAMSNGGNNSFNFGTYSRYDGSRVYDPRRLATINALPAGNIASVMSFTGIGSGSTGVFSGLRLTGSRTAATPKGLYAGGSVAGSTLIVEHCIADDIETSDGVIVGALFDLRCERMIIRFNRAAGTNVDHFWMNAPSAATIVEFYGNEINTGANINRNGPDAIQFNRASGGAYRHLNGYCNWIEHNAASKQGFFVAGSTPADGAESVWWHRNFMFGIADMTGQTDWAGDGSGHTAMQFDTYGYRVYSNYIDGFRSWGNIFGSTTSRALFAYNLCVTENSAFEVTNADSPMWGTGTSGSDYVIAAHNTFWTINSLAATTDAGQAVARIAGANNKLQNNIFAGGWRNGWRLYSGVSQPTNYNLYSGVTNPVINNVNAVIAGGANDISADPLLDRIGSPRFGSPVVNAATPMTDWDGSLLYLTDPFGRTADSPRRQWIGAMQGYAS